MDPQASAHAAALWTGLHLILLLVLSVLVTRQRRKHHVEIGDGGVPALNQAIRAFGNAAEYVPAALVGLGVLALVGAMPLLIHPIGFLLFAGRLMHAAVRIGDSTLMLVDEFPDMGSFGPKALKGSPVTIHLFVEDVDKTVAQALAAGATLKMPVQDMFWGDRYGQLVDPFGHHWSVATHQRDLSPEQVREGMAKMFDR